MSSIDLAALVAAVVGGALGGLRWLRVAQREHYLPGGATRFALRWWRAAPLPAAEGVVAVASAVVAIWWRPAAIVTGVLLGVAPSGLGVRGRTSRLAWTNRLIRVAVGTTILAALVVVLLGARPDGVAGAALAAAMVAVVLPVLVDFDLWLIEPFEDRLAMRFVKRAQAVLERVSPTIVAITGSYGKTSTKGYVAHLLGARFAVLASPRSFNNRAGLARTVNEGLTPGTDILVAEMGTYGPGEIAALCTWLPPKVAAITAIGPVHLERFGSLDRTLAAKSEITAGADTIVLNVDDELLRGLADRLVDEGRSVIRCSAVDREVDVAIIDEGASAAALALYRGGRRVGTIDPDAPGLGAARTNVAVAIGIAFTLGCVEEEVLARLADLPVAESRLTTTRASSGAAVVDDTFNANPAGAEIALAALASLPATRRVVVTPGMIELGRLQAEANADFGERAATVADELVIVGRTNRRALLHGASRTGREDFVHLIATRDEAVAWARENLGPTDAILYENDLPDHFP